MVSNTPRKFLQRLRLIHLAMFSAPFGMGLFFFWQTEVVTVKGQALNDVFVYVLPLFALLGYFASKIVYQRLLAGFKTKRTLNEKLSGFLIASVIRYALLEGPALLNILWFSFTGNLLFLTIGGVLLLFLLLLRPTTDKVVEDLNLMGAHKQQLNRWDDPLVE